MKIASPQNDKIIHKLSASGSYIYMYAYRQEAKAEIVTPDHIK